MSDSFGTFIPPDFVFVEQSIRSATHPYYRAAKRCERSVKVLLGRDKTDTQYRKQVLQACESLVALDKLDFPPSLRMSYVLWKSAAYRLGADSTTAELETCAHWILDIADGVEKWGSKHG
jgi:hypothetical protein